MGLRSAPSAVDIPSIPSLPTVAASTGARCLRVTRSERTQRRGKKTVSTGSSTFHTTCFRGRGTLSRYGRIRKYDEAGSMGRKLFGSLIIRSHAGGGAVVRHVRSPLPGEQHAPVGNGIDV